MKKLISAASALAMAATMVSSVVPFATGAAEATKGFELRAFQNKAGETVSTTISEDAINAGDVTIPIGLYYVEGVADTLSLSAQVTANTKDVSFNIVNAGSAYFDDVKSYTLSDGTSGETNTLVGFSGTLKTNKRGTSFSMSAEATTSSQDTGYEYAGIDTPWASVVWNQPVGGAAYTWAGSKSDDYPIFVLEATFKKGTAAGTYTIDFLDFYDKKNTDISTTMVDAGEGSGTRYSTQNKNINLKGIEITIGGSGDSQPTTTEAPATTTAAPASTTAAPTSTTAAPFGDDSDVEIPEVDVMKDFVITGGEYTAKPGEDIEVEFTVQSGGHKAASFLAELDKLPAGITATMDDDTVYCIEEEKSYDQLGSTYQSMVRDSKTQDPVDILDGEAIICFTFHVPENAANGTYEYNLRQFQVVENSNDPVILFLATRVPGKITIEGGTDTPTTTTEAPKTTTESKTTASTTESKTTASTTEKSTQAGDPKWGDTNCNGVVNIADVVVLNKYLADPEKNPITDQGKLNADCCDPDGGKGLDKNDSQAIIQSIVHLVQLSCTSSELK